MVDTKTPQPDDKTVVKPSGEAASAPLQNSDSSTAKKFIPYVVVVDGPHQGTRFQLREGENPIGRSISSVATLEDQSVSRRHAIITQSRAGWTVADAGSKNGTKVNGQKIKETVNIGHGDVVAVGIYALRLITHQVSIEEELSPPPAEPEGKTVMFSAADSSGEPHGETKTIQQTGAVDQNTGNIEAKGDTDLLNEAAAAEAAGEIPHRSAPEIPEEAPENKKSPWIVYGGMAGAVLLLAIVGGIAWWKFMAKPPKSAPAQVVQQQPAVEGTAPAQPVLPPAPQPAAPKSLPVFLDFASSPLPVKVTLDGKDLGQTPFKINMELETGKDYTAQGLFSLEELGDTRVVPVTFTVNPDSTIIPVLFKGAIGAIKVETLPRDTEIYLEGYYAEEPFKAKTAKLTEVVFGKPIYVPYGKYIVELRTPKEVGGANQFVNDIRFKREVQIGEENPIFNLNLTDADLEKFPVEVRSIPDKADVFIDGQLVGQTPFKGDFPLGEHQLALRKDGFFEHSQSLKMDINTPFQIEVPLKTTVAGQFINAGVAFMNKGLFKDAVAQFAEAFKNQPTPTETAQTQYLLGTCYQRLGDLNTAIGYYEQARAVDAYKYQAMLGLASIYGSQKDLAKALPLLVEVMLKVKDDTIKRDATAVFQQVSPLRSVMYIYTDPEGANVIVNDKPVAQKTPLILHDLGLGNYKVRLQKDGYVSQDLSVNMSITEFNPVIVKLKPIE